MCMEGEFFGTFPWRSHKQQPWSHVLLSLYSPTLNAPGKRCHDTQLRGLGQLPDFCLTTHLGQINPAAGKAVPSSAQQSSYSTGYPASHLFSPESQGLLPLRGSAFAATTWVTLAPLVIVIRITVRFFTTTATHLLPEIIWCTHSLHSSHEASGVHHCLLGIESLHAYCFPGAGFSFGYVLFWMKKHPPLPPSLSFWQPCSSQLDPLFGLWQFLSESKVLLTNSKQLGYSWSGQGKQQLITFTFLDHVDDPIGVGCIQSNQYSGFKASRIWYDWCHLIFLAALNTFHLNTYDDVTQGPGEDSSETMYTQGTIGQVIQGTNVQRMNFNKLWSHCIDGQTTIQKSPTAFTINRDSGHVVRSAPLIKWIGVQEGNFLRHLQALGALSGNAGWATPGFWGVQPPFFAIPSFAFKLAFHAVLLRSFGKSLVRWSGLPHL